MKTLYISDLDGTLLRPDGTVSEYTAAVISRLVDAGVPFSYATARSAQTAWKATGGLPVTAPVVVHNGVMIAEARTCRPLRVFSFSAEESAEIFGAFRAAGLLPIVYSLLGGRCRFSFLRQRERAEQSAFILSRRGDEREREVSSPGALLDGEPYYFSCLGKEGELSPVYGRLKERYRCYFARDIYTGAQWLEVTPKQASKARAALEVKEMLGCGRMVCFGDEINDVPLFEAADECYAVANAAAELKRIATGVVGGNDIDGVARFLEKLL